MISRALAVHDKSLTALIIEKVIMTIPLLAGNLPQHQITFTNPKKKETMMKLNRPSESVLTRYLEAVKSSFPDIEIDGSKTELAIIKIQSVAAETAGEFVARLFFKFELDKMTTLSILPEVLPPGPEQHEDKQTAEACAGSSEPSAVSIRPEAIAMANDIMSIPKVLACVETVANELLEDGTILLPVAWITKKYPEIFGMSQYLHELESGFGSKRKPSKGK